MRLERRLPVGFIERVPLLWVLVADLLALLVALAVSLGWLACLGARGVTRPGLRRAYHLRLPELWP